MSRRADDTVQVWRAVVHFFSQQFVIVVTVNSVGAGPTKNQRKASTTSFFARRFSPFSKAKPTMAPQQPAAPPVTAEHDDKTLSVEEVAFGIESFNAIVQPGACVHAC
jgi:hypothetical protein